MDKKTTESRHLCYRGLLHAASCSLSYLIAKIPLRQHFCLVFLHCKCTKLSSEGDTENQNLNPIKPHLCIHCAEQGEGCGW